MKPTLGILTASLLLVNPQAQAVEDIRWNGYLNVVAGILRDKPVSDNSAREQHPIYRDYDDNFTFNPQTSAVLQAVKDLNDKTSVTAQLYAEGSEDSYSGKFKWIYLTYNPDDNFTFRIGRIGTPVYYFSDFLNVGYAYHWVTPPFEVYPFDTTITGLDYIYRDVYHDIDWTAELYAGAADQELKDIDTFVESRNTIGSVLTASTGGWLTFRVLYFQSKATFTVEDLSSDALIDTAFDNAADEFGVTVDVFEPYRELIQPQVEEALDLQDFTVRYGELAVRAERDNWLLMAEWSTIWTDQYLYNDVESWYVTGGLRFGKVLYHLTYAELDTKLHVDAREDAQFQRTGDTPQEIADQFASAINFNVAQASAQSRHSVSLGTRIETSMNTALKFELTWIESKASYPGEIMGIGDNLLFRTALNVTF